MKGTGWLARRAALEPASLAAVSPDGVHCTWDGLASRVHASARRLAAWGVADGDTVATLVRNGLSLVELVFALDETGAVHLPLHQRLTPAELAFVLRDAGVRWLVHGVAETELAHALADEIPELGLVGTDAAAVPAVAAPRSGSDPSRAREPKAANPHDPPGLDRIRAVLYTSGTTGRPKGAELTHTGFLWSAVGSAAHLGAAPGERWLACLPLFHVGGLAILSRSVLFGGAVVVHERFDPEAVSRALDTEAITLVSLVPTMLARLLDARGSRRPPARLRCVLLGGGPIAPELVERAWDLGWPVAPTYGLTEAASQVATLPLAAIGTHPDVAGRPLLAAQVAISAASGGFAPPGVEGEILVRGPTLMAGYRGRPHETARALRGGWLHTGDVGRLDETGMLRVLDRRDDLIVSGGENVYPAEVEAALAAHPGVIEAGVAAEPDPDLGQRIAAWVVVRDDARLSRDALLAFCRKRLGGHKIPRTIHFIDSLPRTPSGKLQRRSLGTTDGSR